MADLASASVGFYNVIELAKEVGTQTYRFFSARSAADWHLTKLHQEDLEIGYWNSHVEIILKHAGTIPEARLLAIRTNTEDLKDKLRRYDKMVKLWCRRLSVRTDKESVSPIAEDVFEDFLLDPQNKSALESEEKKHRISNQGRSFSVVSRFGFILYGEYRVKNQAREVAELRKLLSIKCIAESRLTTLLVNPETPAATRQSDFIRFITRAQERVRTELPIKVFKILVADAEYEYTDGQTLDPNMEEHPIPEYDLPRVSLTPLPHAAEQGLQAIEHCIMVRRSNLLAISQEHYESEAAKLARMFAEDAGHEKSFLVDRPDSDVLRCCGMVLYFGQGCDLLFKLPPGSNPYPRTLRQLLTDPRSSAPIHPLSDRVKFSIRIVAGLLVVHSLGLVHKRVHPETIVVVEPLAMAETDIFPHRLGHPYLTSLQLARTDDGKTKKLKYKEAIVHRGVYIHPRDQYLEPLPGQKGSDRRLDEYRQRDDIFSAGVCLFEIMCFRSLLVWKEKPEVRFDDYVYDDTFVPLSDNQEAWKGLTSGERAKSKAAVLIEHVKKKIPKALGRRVGKRAAEVVVSFLRAGYEDEAFGVSLKDKSEAEASLFFLSQALRCLREIHRELLKCEKRKRRSQ